MPYTEVIAPSKVHIPNQLLEKASEEKKEEGDQSSSLPKDC
jgi:hypothetical protein